VRPLEEHKSSQERQSRVSAVRSDGKVAVSCHLVHHRPHLQLVVVHVEVLYERHSVQCTTLLGYTTVMIIAMQQQQDAAVVDD
jgi:hypothetical protein